LAQVNSGPRGARTGRALEAEKGEWLEVKDMVIGLKVRSVKGLSG